LKGFLADLATVVKVLAVITTANALILGYFSSNFPQYVVIASGVLAGVMVVSSVLQSVVNTFAVSRILAAQVAAGAKAGSIADLTAALSALAADDAPAAPVTPLAN
jgi:hypothetical protein